MFQVEELGERVPANINCRNEKISITNIKGEIKKRDVKEYDKLWEQLNAKTSATDDHNTAEPLSSADKATSTTVKIVRTYEFAGKTVTEEKEVPRDSAEAKAHLDSIHFQSQQTEKALNSKSLDSSATKAEVDNGGMRKPMKRVSKLGAMQSNKTPKLNVLEKSRLDWAGFVDKEGISDDLKHFNKDGYVEKQEFLRRTEERRR